MALGAAGSLEPVLGLGEMCVEVCTPGNLSLCSLPVFQETVSQFLVLKLVVISSLGSRLLCVIEVGLSGAGCTGFLRRAALVSGEQF